MRRVALAALAVAVGMVVLLVMVRPGPGPEPEPPVPPDEVATMLVQLRDSTGYAAANVVLGTPPPSAPVGLLGVPASLLLPVGDDSVTLGRALELSDTLASVRGVSAGLGIPIDAGLALDRLALAGLVDAVRGVWVDVPETTPLSGPEGPTDPIRVVGPGWELMDGLTAADYALTRLPGEPESALLDRFVAVLDSALSRLPTSPERLAQLLSSLGALAQPTVPSGVLVDPLLRAGLAARSDSIVPGDLPVLIIRDGLRPASVPAPGWEWEIERVLSVVPGEG